MYKLLTSEEKSLIKKEYKLRVVAIALTLFCSLLLYIFSSLLPIYIFAEAQQNASKLTLQGAETDKDTSESLKVWVERVKLKLGSLSVEKIDEPYKEFQKVLALKPNGIRITNLGWQRTTKALTIKVAGTARDRKSLIAFQSSINNSGKYAPVEFPVSALSKETNINFEFLLSPKP